MYSSMVATHPVVLVPLELLSEIFLFRKGSENPENWLLSLIRICHVCTKWRRVAFSTPKLWVHFCVLIKTPRRVIPPAAAWLRRFKFLGHTRSKNGADLLNAWLRRAGPHKTTVCIGSETRRAPDGVVRGLLGVSSNIVSLALNLSSPEYFALSRLPPGLFPSLEELTLCSDGTEDWYRPVLTFADTPALRSLSLLGNHEFDPYDIQRLFSVPWQQLTCLIVRHFFSPRGVAFVLGKCRALQRCTIDDVTPGCDRTADVPPPPLVIAVFPAMQRFDARFVDADPGREDGGTTCLPGFQRLSFPALRHFSLTRQGAECVPHFHHFTGFAERSFDQLESLTFYGVHISLDLFAHTLDRLVTLNVELGSAISVSLFEGMNPRVTSHPSLSRLKRLRIVEVERTCARLEQAFVDMVRSRCLADIGSVKVSQLESVSFSYANGDAFDAELARQLFRGFDLGAKDLHLDQVYTDTPM